MDDVKVPLGYTVSSETNEILNDLCVYKINLLALSERMSKTEQKDIDFIIQKVAELEMILDEFIIRYEEN